MTQLEKQRSELAGEIKAMVSNISNIQTCSICVCLFVCLVWVCSNLIGFFSPLFFVIRMSSALNDSVNSSWISTLILMHARGSSASSVRCAICPLETWTSIARYAEKRGVSNYSAFQLFDWCFFAFFFPHQVVGQGAVGVPLTENERNQ